MRIPLKSLTCGLCIVSSVLLLGCASTNGLADTASPPRVSADVPAKKAVPKAKAASGKGKPASYTVKGNRYNVLPSAKNYEKTGMASWYGAKFHGKLTSSSEPYNMHKMTAASPHLPLLSYAHVTNLANGRTVVVKVNDRGPFKSDRILDLSYAAAKALGYLHHGTAKIRVTGIDATDKKTVLASEQKHGRAIQTPVGVSG